MAAFDKVDDMVQTLNDLFLEIVNKHAPIKRNKFSKMIDKAKKEIYRNKLEEGQDDPRTIFKTFQQFGACKKWNLQKMISTLKLMSRLSQASK